MAAGAAFRRWLIERLAGTHFATAMVSEEKLEALARALGVCTEVLREARRMASRQRARAGLPEPLGQKRAGSGHKQLELLMPENIFRSWKLECERRSISSPALLRSMLHAYLLDDREPEEIVNRIWVWRGRQYSIDPHGWRKRFGVRYPFRERVLLPSGAYRALRHRANRLGCSLSAIARALVLGALDGTWAKPAELKIIDARAMFDDERRYWLG